MHHRHRDANEAHLTVVFTAVAIARDLQDETGFNVRRIIRTLCPLQDITITLASQKITARPGLTDDARTITNALKVT